MKQIFLIFIIITGEICSGYNSINITTNWTLSFYKKIISPLQGQYICNFSPTCSQFFRNSVNKYGFIIGALMGADRLLRCNPSAWNYLDRYYFGIQHDRIYDPPQNHYIKKLLFDNQAEYHINDKPRHTDRSRQGTDTIMQITSLTFRDSDTAIKKIQMALDFADYLFTNQDYLRAIGEYKRVLFNINILPNYTDLKQYIQLKLGEAYLSLKAYDQSLFYFSQHHNPYFYLGQARTFFAQGNYIASRDKLQLLENTELDKERIIFTGWSYYKEKNFKMGAQFFESNKPNDCTTHLFIKLAKYNGQGLKHRNRVLSTLFSSIIPGLGQIYCGRVGDGLYSFITVVSCGLIANHYYHNDTSRIKFGIFTVLTAYFWLGNIYGANICARDYNEFQIQDYQNQIDSLLSNYDLLPNYHYLIEKYKQSE